MKYFIKRLSEDFKIVQNSQNRSNRSTVHTYMWKKKKFQQKKGVQNDMYGHPVYSDYKGKGYHRTHNNSNNSKPLPTTIHLP